MAIGVLSVFNQAATACRRWSHEAFKSVLGGISKTSQETLACFARSTKPRLRSGGVPGPFQAKIRQPLRTTLQEVFGGHPAAGIVVGHHARKTGIADVSVDADDGEPQRRRGGRRPRC